MASCFPALVENSRDIGNKYGIVRFLSLVEDLGSEVVFMIKVVHWIRYYTRVMAGNIPEFGGSN